MNRQPSKEILMSRLGKFSTALLWVVVIVIALYPGQWW
jgi:hypothetical protein